MQEISFNYYIEMVKSFRAHFNLPAPTDAEISEWQADWATLTKKRRASQIKNFEDHLVIANVPRPKNQD
jgi:hypothetical protein